MAVAVYRITENNFYRLLEDGATYRILELIPESVPIILPPGKGDITKTWIQAAGYADYTLTGAVLAAGANLQTAIINSLFSDRLAAADDEIPDGTTNRRGWWADNTLGSKLWLLDRSKLTRSTANDCTAYCKEALQWLIDDGVAVETDVNTVTQLPDAMAASIDIYRQNGQRVATSFAWVWQGVN